MKEWGMIHKMKALYDKGKGSIINYTIRKVIKANVKCSPSLMQRCLPIPTSVPGHLVLCALALYRTARLSSPKAPPPLSALICVICG